MTDAFRIESLAGAVTDMFNTVSRAHNVSVDKLSGDGVSQERSALVSYLVFRVALLQFEAIVRESVDPSGWPAVEAMVRAMTAVLRPAGSTQPGATA